MVKNPKISIVRNLQKIEEARKEAVLERRTHPGEA
jgi:hypothetical protein